MPPRSRLVWMGPGLLSAALATIAAAAPATERGPPSGSVPVVTLGSLLEEMVDRDRLARLPQPEYCTGREERVMMDAAGPGAITRFWMGAPHPDRGPDGTIPPGGEVVEGEAMEIRAKTGGVTEVQTERRGSAGKHRFVAEIVGTNPAAKPRYMLGLDFVRLEPQE